MFIKALSMRNFRNFRSAKFKFIEGGVNTVIGENASGKSNVFHAMRLMIDDSLPLNSRYLNSGDFNRSLEEPRGHWIVISMELGGLGKSDEELALARHSAQLSSAEAVGVYTYLFRPKYRIRKELHDATSQLPSTIDRVAAARAILDKISFDKEFYEVVSLTRSSVDFCEDAAYERYAGNSAAGIYPDPDDDDAADLGNLKPAYFSLPREVSCTFVKALRNVVADLKYARSNPLLSLLSQAGGSSMDVTGAHKIVDAAKQLNSLIGQLEPVKNLSDGVRETILAAVGQTYSPSIDISSNVPEDIGRLVQSLGLIAEDTLGESGSGSMEDLSLGGANLIYIALKLYEYERQKARDGKVAHFLIIEEPEAHIHTHIQKTLFAKFSSTNTQIFVSTHSTQISSAANISGVNVISRKHGRSEVFWPSNGLDPKEISKIERYLDAVRGTLLFAKSVMVCEGDAEQILIPYLVRKVLGVSLDEMGISLLCINGTVFTHISTLFDKQRLRNNCAILTDEDAAFLRAETSYADSDYVRHLLSSEAAGAARKDELEAHCRGNEFVSCFFAKHTFEIELLAAGNFDLYKRAVAQIYSRKHAENQALNDLQSDDLPRRYHRALQLANKEGKGWFALLLSDGVDASTRIPKYILQGIRHALGAHATTGLYKQIIDYRLRRVNLSLAAIESDVGPDLGDILDVVEDVLPDDEVLELIK